MRRVSFSLELVRHIHVALSSRVVVVLLKSSHSGATVKLRPATALFIPIVLAEMGREETFFQSQKKCYLKRTAKRLITNRHAQHSRSCASSWTGCRGRESPPRGQQARDWDRRWYSRATKSAAVNFIAVISVMALIECVPLGGSEVTLASQSCSEISGRGSLCPGLLRIVGDSVIKATHIITRKIHSRTCIRDLGDLVASEAVPAPLLALNK